MILVLGIPLAVDLALAVGPLLVQGVSRVYTRMANSGDASDDGSMDSVDDSSGALPSGWERWNGARPELRGYPRDTILNFHGLSTTTPEFRAELLNVAERSGIPVDSLAMVLSHESGFNPKALNPLPAVGIFQLTLQANLPPWNTKDALLALLDKTATEQLVPLEAFYDRTHGKDHGDNPGQLLMANFLPAFNNRPEDTVLGRRPPELASGYTPADLAALKDTDNGGRKLTGEEQIYCWNSGMDVNHDGVLTIGDVYEGAASLCKVPHGQRMRIDGTVIPEPAALAPVGP